MPALAELRRVDLAGLAQLLDEPLRRAGAAVVAVEAPGIELVPFQVDLERPPEQVVVAEVAVVDARFGAAAVLDELPGVLGRHDRGAVLSLEEAHTTRGRRVEERREYCRLVETGDVNHVGHVIASSCISGGYASHRVSVCFL